MWYTIKGGDSLSKLAAQYLGNMMDFMLIYEQNKDVLENPDVLPVGTRIWIPVSGQSKSKLSTNQMLTIAGVGMLLITGSMALKKMRQA